MRTTLIYLAHIAIRRLVNYPTRKRGQGLIPLPTK